MSDKSSEVFRRYSTWEPLSYALARLIFASRNKNTIDVQTYIERYGFQPEQSPYFVIVCEPDKSITIEIAGDAHVKPALTPAECSRMVELGWAAPHAGKDEDYGIFPNFSRNFAEDTDDIDIAHHLLHALSEVYSMSPDEQIGLSSQKAADWLDAQRVLRRLGPAPYRDTRHIFQKKGTGLLF